MIHRERLDPPDYVYPADEWRIVEKRFYPRFLEQMETIFALANGYLGMRGDFEEGRPVVQRGTYVNGFYESWPITYGEEAFGFAKTGQTIINVPDAKTIKLYVDDEPFCLRTANLLHFERVLDMKAGTLDREVLWETQAGKRVAIRSRRLVSFRHRHLAAISYEVEVLNDEAPIAISSEVAVYREDRNREEDPRLPRGFSHNVLHPRVHYREDRRIVHGFRTRSSKMTLGVGIDHMVETDCPYTCRTDCTEDTGKVVLCIDAKPGVPIRLVKYMSYHTSRSAPPEELCARTERTLDRAVQHGFGRLLETQREFLDDFWTRSDIEVRADPKKAHTRTEDVQQAIRFNLFHIIQAAGRAEGSGIPAKGLTGHGYEGQYFWDMEIYVLPFLVYTTPRIARNILKFRHSMLDKARQRARDVNQKGALFPWRTINGEEASAYYAAGTAQYHINADVMYALKKYVQVTGDEAFLRKEGAEMLVETARLWVDLGFFSKRKGGKFCIHGVTGPDEYNTVVNNNTYTNLMARENLRFAVSTVEMLRDKHPEQYTELEDRTSLRWDEVEEWRRAAENMFVPYDTEEGIHPQDDSFLDKERWDFENTPPDKYPLLLFYHPLVIYRHQVIKQTDVMLAMFLLGHDFSPEEKKRNFDYYDPLTTGDSSLSVGIQSIIASEIGYMEKALEYARYAVLMDLADVGGNVKDGCHIASMGATWMVLVNGFGGMRDYDGQVSFSPRLSERFRMLRFPLTVRGQTIEVHIEGKSVTYSLRKGDGITIWHQGEKIYLTPKAPTAVRSCCEKAASA